MITKKGLEKILFDPKRSFLLKKCLSIRKKLTFNTDNVFSNLLDKIWIMHQVYQIINSVDGRMHGLEPLYLLPDGVGIWNVGDIAPTPSTRHHYFLEPKKWNTFDLLTQKVYYVFNQRCIHSLMQRNQSPPPLHTRKYLSSVLAKKMFVS